MNSVFTRLRLPRLTPPPPPAQNTFRLYAVQFDTNGLNYLQQLLDVQIGKKLYGFEDEFSCSETLTSLMWLDSLLPDDPEVNVVLDGPDRERLQLYTGQKLLAMMAYNRSILENTSLITLSKALFAIRHNLAQATTIIPLHLYQ